MVQLQLLNLVSGVGSGVRVVELTKPSSRTLVHLVRTLSFNGAETVWVNFSSRRGGAGVGAVPDRPFVNHANTKAYLAIYEAQHPDLSKTYKASPFSLGTSSL